MHNSHNHATPGHEGDKHWWLAAEPIEAERRVIFSFIDYGVGIFSSLNDKKENNKWFGWALKIKDKLKHGDNAEILRLILQGELHRTVSGKYYRGKGLPGIKEAMDKNQISNLYIITNNVFADVANDVFKVLPCDFAGTLVGWELNSKNQSYPWYRS